MREDSSSCLQKQHQSLDDIGYLCGLAQDSRQTIPERKSSLRCYSGQLPQPPKPLPFPVDQPHGVFPAEKYDVSHATV